LAGTVATLAQLTTGLAAYDRDAVHHQILTRTQVQQWRDELGRRTPDERLALPGMVAGREDVLTAGLYILDAVLERFAIDQFLTSEDDILDGVVRFIQNELPSE
jgi:exopolyphosphatase/guanosine-5'-triphosphate,3'-diphosphate pyrophosphatase